MRHPNIVIFMGACIVPAQREMLLVMEFMDKGSLNDVLHNPQVGIFNNKNIKVILSINTEF